MLSFGCGPDARDVADHDRVCGHDGPWRLLELDEGVAPIWSPLWGVRRIGDRLYYVVGDVPQTADFQGGLEPHPVPGRTTVWSTGLCGESPRELAEDIYAVHEHELFPGVVFGTTDEDVGDVVVIDPDGVTAPQPFLRDVATADAWTSHGVVSIAPSLFEPDESGTLHLLPYPASVGAPVPSPVVLAEDVAVGWKGPMVVQDEVFVRTAAGGLIVVDLVDRTRTNLADDAEFFDVSSDGRHVAWQARGTDEPPTGGPVDLHDRDTGTTVRVAEASHQCCGPRFADERHLGVPFDAGDAYATRLVSLTSREQLDLPWAPLRRLPDGRWLGVYGSGKVVTFDPSTVETQTLLRADGWLRYDDQRLLSHMRLDEPRSPSEYARSEFALWEAVFDGREPRQLARRVTGYQETSDGRIVTLVDIGDDFIGDLVVVDSDTLDERLVDDHAFVRTVFPLALPVFDDPDLVTYVVQDGDRSGVWVTRLAVE